MTDITTHHQRRSHNQRNHSKPMHRGRRWAGRGSSSERRGGNNNSSDRPSPQPPGASVGETTEHYCSICHDESPKYKCPRCRCKYCGVACYQRHKAERCVRVSTEVTAAPTQNNSLYLAKVPNIEPRPAKRMKNHHQDLEEGWKITDNMKQKMKESSWLQTELQDAGLQHLIVQIYEASNLEPKRRNDILDVSFPGTQQEKLLMDLKNTNPCFQQFIDKILVLTDILEPQGEMIDCNEALLTCANKITRMPLALKALSRKIRPVLLNEELVGVENSNSRARGEIMSDESSSSDENSEDDTNSDVLSGAVHTVGGL